MLPRKVDSITFVYCGGSANEFAYRIAKDTIPTCTFKNCR